MRDSTHALPGEKGANILLTVVQVSAAVQSRIRNQQEPPHIFFSSFRRTETKPVVEAAAETEKFESALCYG